MNENERDKWDDAIRSRLKDFEADTTPADWEAIADRLPGKAPVPLRRTRRYWTVAAAIAALSLLSGGIYFYERKAGKAIPALASIPAGQTADEGKLAEEPARRPAERTPLLATAGERGVKGINVARAPRALARVSRGVSPDRGVTMRATVLAEGRDTSLVAGNRQAAEASPASADRKESAATRGRSLIAEAAPVSSAENVSGKKRGKVRKWGFGMGGGGFSVGADNMVPRYVTNSDALRSENLMALNALDAAMAPPAETDIRHRTPIGFGLSVSRYLNDRFSLQTGVTYSYLRSEWSTNNTYHVDNDQRLHFIGIPLSILCLGGRDDGGQRSGQAEDEALLGRRGDSRPERACADEGMALVGQCPDGCKLPHHPLRQRVRRGGRELLFRQRERYRDDTLGETVQRELAVRLPFRVLRKQGMSDIYK